MGGPLKGSSPRPTPRKCFSRSSPTYWILLPILRPELVGDWEPFSASSSCFIAARSARSAVISSSFFSIALAWRPAASVHSLYLSPSDQISSPFAVMVQPQPTHLNRFPTGVGALTGAGVVSRGSITWPNPSRRQQTLCGHQPRAWEHSERQPLAFQVAKRPSVPRFFAPG